MLKEFFVLPIFYFSHDVSRKHILICVCLIAISMYNASTWGSGACVFVPIVPMNENVISGRDQQCSTAERTYCGSLHELCELQNDRPVCNPVPFEGLRQPCVSTFNKKNAVGDNIQKTNCTTPTEFFACIVERSANHVFLINGLTFGVLRWADSYVETLKGNKADKEVVDFFDALPGLWRNATVQVAWLINSIGISAFFGICIQHVYVWRILGYSVNNKSLAYVMAISIPIPTSLLWFILVSMRLLLGSILDICVHILGNSCAVVFSWSLITLVSAFASAVCFYWFLMDCINEGISTLIVNRAVPIVLVPIHGPAAAYVNGLQLAPQAPPPPAPPMPIGTAAA